MNNTFDMRFIYSSNLPIFVFICFEFIWDRVYLPLNITIPIIEPAATTVFAHPVLSKFSDYFLPALLVKLPKKSYISSQAGAYIILPSTFPIYSLLAFKTWCVDLIALLTFQSVSPSNWSVLIKIDPLSSEVVKITTSAGTRSLACSSMIFPTLI
jgi:hypothetical protein